MEKQPGFVPKLTLEEMALRKLVVHFWSQTDILALIEEFPFTTTFGKETLWQETVEDKVKDKISKLDFPESLKRRMNLIVKPIGLQIPEWVSFMEQFLCDSRENLDIQLLKQLCWTSAGALDYEKTAEKLVSLKTLNVVERFKTACGHCLVDSLPVVWKELPEEHKSRFSKGLLNDRFIWLENETLLRFYWSYVLNGEEYELLERHIDIYREAFASSARRGNKAAADYFLKKLNNEERNSSLFLVFHEEIEREAFYPWASPRERTTDVSCYLLSQMTPEQQMQVLRDFPGHVFRIFLDWRWQDLFLEKTDFIWNFLPEKSTYNDLLHHIRRKMIISEYFSPELFQEFFRRSPSAFRKYFVNQECLGEALFSKFLNNEDKETVRVILRNIDVEDRVRLVSCLRIFECFESLLGRKGQDVVELCVREACPSKEDRERLKEVYMGFLIGDEKHVFLRGKKNWQRFFQSLDIADASGPQKRSLEDEMVTRAKRLRRRNKKKLKRKLR
ncbi:hypothetical protein AVEN_48619-1 [Araneus ventricosus]|uniref:Uncharacterized protein n=1 Tax=Araneus ventricosus TaxID=182803 RepID=A0A4Y2IXS3_ARAVE|nr:hypothetical protein AVEN_48619-1 [Araneus ventricosus]